MFSMRVETSISKEKLEYYDTVILGALKNHFVKNAERFFFAIHELMINAIQSYEQDMDSTVFPLIEMELFINERFVRFEIKDYGKGIDFEKEAYMDGVQDKLHELEDHGRGLYLIDQLVDEFHWYRSEDNAFKVVIENRY